MAQQAEVEHLADVTLAGQVQPQPAHVDLAQVAIGGHAQAQAQQGAVALDRVVQLGQFQRQHLGGIGRAETAGHSAYRLGLDWRVTRHAERLATALDWIELQHAERRQRPHVIRPQEVHQRVGQLRQLVVEFLPQPPGEKGEAF